MLFTFLREFSVGQRKNDRQEWIPEDQLDISGLSETMLGYFTQKEL